MGNNEKAEIAVLQSQVVDIKSDLTEIKEHYLTREEFSDKFEPVKRLAYGLVSVILLAVAGVAGTAIQYFLSHSQ